MKTVSKAFALAAGAAVFALGAQPPGRDGTQLPAPPKAPQDSQESVSPEPDQGPKIPEPRQAYFAFNGYFVDPDDIRGTDREGAGGDAIFGLQIYGPLYLEARGFGQIFEKGPNGGADFYNAGGALDAQLLLGRRGDFAAFAVGGVGAAYNDMRPNSLDEWVFQASGGIGVLSPNISPGEFRIRGEARAVYEDYLGDVVDYRIGLGIEIPLDRDQVIVETVATPVAQLPTPLPPGTYPPRPAPDQDGDGVFDTFDRCPGTMPGMMVDQSGCVAELQTVTLEGVNFEFDSDRLTSDSDATLERAVAAMKGQPGIQVEIAGHTDSVGNKEYNLLLSLKRALAVRRYLTANGVSPERLTVVGFGEEEPVASNETEEGRAQNRRVMFCIRAINGPSRAKVLGAPTPQDAAPADDPQPGVDTSATPAGDGKRPDSFGY